MPEMEQQDKTLSELIVKEAITKGMDSPMRDSILEAVEESDGARSGRRLPLAGALFSLGAAVGFLAGRQSQEMEGTSIEDIEEPDIIEDVRETAETTAAPEEVDVEVESRSRRLPKSLLVVGALAGAALIRRLLSGDEEEEWEPIEEFEPATGGEAGDEMDEESGEETEETESEASEGEGMADETEE
ncbi:hypothetical protein [Natrinema halophilum]|uniref:MYXO-CTERM domain-containing protein n=1 Tax=Natrinema halophilum TaxID=1699371 RepID=A0A7D5KWP0_9EURY|nr:hypothetical protein [Natrinema halophilum]QLG47782.1 hypothetical protein HYG82_02440 [Natrinema halophilum]